MFTLFRGIHRQFIAGFFIFKQFKRLQFNDITSYVI